jgi:two-component system cell cycle sensor histidine kinase/response regulator CckA
MQSPSQPRDEPQRLASLREFEVLDTLREQALDDLTALAADICGTPISLISLIDEHRQWFKSTVGLSLDETARDVSFCGHAILQPGLFVVPDASLDTRFADNPLVTGEPHIRFYAGAPLTTSDGHALGALCVMDRVPRALTAMQVAALQILSRQAMAQLELRRHMRALVAKEAASRQLAAIVEWSEDAIIGKDLDGVVQTWNRGAERILGYTADEMIGTPIRRLIPADRQSEEDVILDRIRRGESVDHFETVRRTKSGRLIDVSITASPIRDAEGRVVGASKVARDITERKRVDAALRSSEGRYRALFDYAPDGILIADAQSRYLDANPSMCQMLGYTRDELVGLSAADIVADAELPHIAPALESINANADYHRQWTFRRKDGSLFPADVIATTLPDGNLVGMVRDVTERNRAVDALRVAEERMRFALDSAQVGIWDMDYRSGVLRWSETLESQYGLAPASFDGRFETFVEHVHPDDRETLLAGVSRAMASGEDFTVQHRAIRRDGSVRWLTGAGRVFLDAQGQPARGLGISMDVTERRSLEAQYQQAQKMEAIGRLAGGVAHDFNNLLTVILGYSQLLLRSLPIDDVSRADVTEIQKAGASAAALTRQLLSFSRKEIIEPTLVDLNTIIADLRDMLGRLLGEDLSVTLRLAPSLAAVRADRGQMEQVVMNLVVNARDAMPEGGLVTIETANIDLDSHYARTHLSISPGAYVVLTVTDSGTGMSAEVQSHLFEPFFTTKERGKGTGLGLATIHGIVTQAGGAVNVYSEVGRGSSFKVYLPVAEAAPAVEAAPDTGRSSGERLTVLVVEDADNLRALAERLLQELGHTVLTAANAQQARQRFKAHASIDLLLTDVVMPDTSGPDLATHLLNEHPSLKVVFMSGYTEHAIVQRGVLTPGLTFLHKPFTVEALDAKIREACGR